MKTLIVLCSLATFAIAVPTPLRENLDNIYSSLENIPDETIREKKSPQQDASQDITHDDEKENIQMRHSLKKKIETQSPGTTKVGFKKPIIIKKKLGYHVYRDSDEEMAHADPYENCRKQFKVKLCDGEPILHTHSNNVKSLFSERAPESVSDKEMINSIRMAKEAVDHLERGLQKLEHNSAKMSNSMERLDSGNKLQQDIEIAKNAIEHIQRSMGNLESIESQLNNPELKETQDLKSINQWKEAMDKIHKNVDISKNIEDAFNIETHNLQHSDNLNVPKMSENEQSKGEQAKKKENEILLKDNSIQSSLPFTKTINEDISDDHKLSSKSKTSSTKDEQDINENDMFVATTDHKESKMRLHSESLTSENDFNTKSLDGQDNTELNLNRNDHSIIDTQAPELKAAESAPMTKLQHNGEEAESILPVKNNILTKNILGAKSNENTKLTKQECEETQHEHNLKEKSAEVRDQMNTETKALIKEKFSSEDKMDTTEQTFKASGTEQKNIEYLNKESSDMENMHSSHPKMTISTEKEEKDKDLLHHQKHVVISEPKLFARVNVINNEENYLNREFNSLSPQVNHENIHSLSLTAAGPREEQHMSNEFSMRMTENHNTNSVHNEHMEDQLNDFHESFMRLAQEKQLNDMLSHHLKTVATSNNEQTMNRNEFMPIEHTNVRMHQIKNMGPQNGKDGNHGLHDFSSMPLAPNNQPIDYLTQNFKSTADLHNDHVLPTFSKMNGLKNGDTSLNGHTNMRLIEGLNLDNMGHQLSESKNFNDPLLNEHWVQEKQQKGVHTFKTISELNNREVLDTNGHHTGQHAHKQQMNMRIPEHQNLGHLFTDSELHDSHSMPWGQEKQHYDDFMQTFDTEAQLHNEHLNSHLHESMPASRFNNKFSLDNSHDMYPMRSRMPDDFHVVKHGKSYDMDSAMQPSMHIGMRDSDTQWGHHQHHHGMSRSSYSPSQPNSSASSGAVGVFSNANTGCGIPLLLSCSPSVVSGSLTKAQPMGLSGPAYRSGENLVYYMKRDANKIEGKQNDKIQKAPIQK